MQSSLSNSGGGTLLLGMGDYGERRVGAVGQVEGIVLVVLYMPRDDTLRIISARRANRRERHVYQQTIEE